MLGQALSSKGELHRLREARAHADPRILSEESQPSDRYLYRALSRRCIRASLALGSLALQAVASKQAEQQRLTQAPQRSHANTVAGSR